MNNSLTVAIFAKNEDTTVAPVIDGILALYNPSAVLLVVNDISEFIRELAYAKTIRLLQDNGKGKGSAIREVINSTVSDILVFVDADGSHIPADIPRLIQPLAEDRADMVIASRFLGGSEEFSGSLDNNVHRWGNYLSAFIIQLLWGNVSHGLIDCQNGFRAVRATAVKKLYLQENGFAIEQEMVIQGLKHGLRIAQVPSFEHKRKYGESHIQYSSALGPYIGSILRNILFK